MPEYNGSVKVDVPVDDVFQYFLDPEFPVAVNAAVREITNTEEQDDGGYHADMTYTMVGINFDGRLEVEVIEPNEELVYRFDGPGLDATAKWTFNERNGGTEVIQHVDYELTGTALDKLLEPVAVRYNTRQFDAALETSKIYIEEHAAAPA